MRLIVTAASLSVTIAASQAFLSVSSTHAVDNVDLAYNSKTQKQGASDSFSVGEECFYRMSANSIGVDADIGILSGCSDSDLVCVEDLQSALGGRCASPTEKQRQLQITCTKCTPSSACEGLDPTFIENNIGDGSCCGEKACVGVSIDSTIGAGSCIGYKNCYSLQIANIGDGSCNGYSTKGKDGYVGYACAYVRGTIGDNSCYEYAACYQSLDDSNKGYAFNVGNNSCQKKSSCFYSSETSIGDGSCAGEYACYKSYGAIGESSCNGYYACYKNTGVIGDNSCNAKLACEENSAFIGDLFCNSYAECRGNTSPMTTAPSRAPTRTTTPPPTNKPETSSPTIPNGTPLPTAQPVTPAPTMSPTKKPIHVTTSPTRKPTTSSPTKPNGTSPPTLKPINSPTASPTKQDETLAPTKTPTPSPSPSNKPTKDPSTKVPTFNPITSPPTQRPTTLSSSLLLSVDLCYPGCGNFEVINRNNAFEESIMKYIPCSPNDCSITIVASSSTCVICNITSPGGVRFLQGEDFQSSAVIFQIVSTTPLNEEVVLENLNSNVTNANNDLSGNSMIRVSGTFTMATLQSTPPPTNKPSVSSSNPHHGKSSKSFQAKSSKSDNLSKSSKSKKSHAGKKKKEGGSKQDNMAKKLRKKNLQREKKKKEFVHL